MALTDDPALLRLFTKLNNEKGLDFTRYKEKSVLRRIETRLKKHNLDSYDDYIRVLDSNPEEYTRLLGALTINVTEFFRNPESFEAIRKVVIPRIIYSKRALQHKIIRAWSCGCSFGDEPYSLAMLFMERLGNARDKFLLAVIGSDIDKEALDNAGPVIYSRDRLRAVDRGLLDKYFDKMDGDKFRLKTKVTGLVRFRRHDIVKDKPFLNCDLILCRNLLIYFNKELQEEVLLKFYECLNPGGFLVLGMVESLVGASVNAFEHVNNRLRIYRRPKKTSLAYQKEGILSQEEIDKIVSDILEKE